jgi:uncharacterized protein YjbI with pentapeptide repeats
MPWRTEPEIDAERKAYLAERRAIKPDIERGLYPFRDEHGSIKLTRADVEWLLATHEGGRGPVRWEDEKDKTRDEQRWGLDLRGADLRAARLGRLPLASLRAGLMYAEAFGITDEPHSVPPEQREWAAAHLVTPEQREWAAAHLEAASLTAARLEGAALLEAHLEGASLLEAHLERSSLIGAHLAGVNLRRAHLDGTNLRGAHLEGKCLTSEQLPQVRPGAPTCPDELAPADLRGAYFSPATYLGWATFGDDEHGFVAVAGVRWGGVDLSRVQWERQPGTRRRRLPTVVLGDEREARQPTDDTGTPKPASRRLDEFEAAVRANRQLATVLRDQGLNERADHFAFRAQVLQRSVLRRQGSWGRWAFSWLLAGLAGYGYRLRNILIAYGLTLVGFALAYLLVGLPYVHPVPIVQTVADAFQVSLTAIHGRVFFEQFGIGSALAWVAAVESVAGIVIEGVFVAMLVQRFFAR